MMSCGLSRFSGEIAHKDSCCAVTHVYTGHKLSDTESESYVLLVKILILKVKSMIEDQLKASSYLLLVEINRQLLQYLIHFHIIFSRNDTTSLLRSRSRGRAPNTTWSAAEFLPLQTAAYFRTTFLSLCLSDASGYLVELFSAAN